MSDARTGMRFLLSCLCGWTKGMFQGQQLASLKDRGSPACCAWFLKSEGSLGHQDKGLRSGTIPERLTSLLDARCSGNVCK